MKIYSIIIIVFFLSLNLGYAQTHNKIKIPVVKENSEIDSLLKSILDSKTPPQYLNGDQNQKLDCITIRFDKNKDNEHYGFLVATETHLGVNQIINRVKDNFGYFKYRNFNVFIWSFGGLKRFVLKTSENKTFSYIYRIINLNSPINSAEGKMWDYNYQNGHFLIDNPPIMR